MVSLRTQLKEVLLLRSTHEDDEQALAEIDKSLIGLCAQILTQESQQVYTTITIDTESSEDLAFMKVIEQFDDWWYHEEQEELRDESNLYTYEVVLTGKKYIYYDHGDRNYWSYEFEVRKP